MTGCTLGSDFQSLAAPQTHAYDDTPLPKRTASTSGVGMSGQAQTFVAGKDISAEWWKIFHSEPLNQLIQHGLANSPNLAAAQAALTQAQGNLRAQVGSLYYPAFTANLGGEK